MRKKKRERLEHERLVQTNLEMLAAAERAKEATALRRRGYLTADGHFPWKVPVVLWDLYKQRYPDLGTDLPESDILSNALADATAAHLQAAAVDDKGPAKPARKRTAKKAPTATKPARKRIASAAGHQTRVTKDEADVKRWLDDIDKGAAAARKATS